MANCLRTDGCGKGQIASNRHEKSALRADRAQQVIDLYGFY
jgi:hypothetical protein